MLVLDWDRMRARRAGRAVLAFVALAFSLAATPGRADEAALEQVGAGFRCAGKCEVATGAGEFC